MNHLPISDVPVDGRLPEALSAYFEAERTGDAARLAACFAPEGRVLDEGRHHTGPAAVQAWMQAAKARYQHVAQPLRWQREGQVVTVVARVSGHFPGSPLELAHVFELGDDGIRSLEIHP